MNTQKLFNELPLSFLLFLVSSLHSALFPKEGGEKGGEGVLRRQRCLPMSSLFREGLGEVLVLLALRIGIVDCVPLCLQDRFGFFGFVFGFVFCDIDLIF